MDNRTPRETQTREATKRRSAYRRQSAIPTPDPRPGLTHRWIRTATLGNSDNPNVSRRFREGYTPVKAADYPELHVLSDHDSRFKGNVEVGGLLLCAASTELVEDRVEYQTERAQSQMDAVDRNYMRESDPRMPVLRPERATKTSFGK
jgi:hypothetical protein